MTPEEYARKISRRFHNTLIDHQGIKLLMAGGGHARAELAMSPAVAQPTGLFHAGAIIGLADTTATSAGSPRPILKRPAMQPCSRSRFSYRAT